MTTFHELPVANELLADAERLRAALRGDGLLFVRGLLSPDDVA